jgi:PTS system nitrogen regulatory IIA component
MLSNNAIKPDIAVCRASVTSKKRALEKLSEYLAQYDPNLTDTVIFDKLLERERLGSTGLGGGVAIPHCRLAEARQAVVALMTLDSPVDFDSRDKKPVDILFALIVPEDCNEMHLKILATAAEMFSDPKFCQSLRSCESDSDLRTLSENWQPSSLSV